MLGRLGHHDTQQKLTDCSHCQLSSQIIRVHYLVWDLVLAALSCPYTNHQQPHGKGIFAGCRFHQDWNTLDDTNNSHREQSTEKKKWDKITYSNDVRQSQQRLLRTVKWFFKDSLLLNLPLHDPMPQHFGLRTTCWTPVKLSLLRYRRLFRGRAIRLYNPHHWCPYCWCGFQDFFRLVFSLPAS